MNVSSFFQQSLKEFFTLLDQSGDKNLDSSEISYEQLHQLSEGSKYQCKQAKSIDEIVRGIENQFCADPNLAAQFLSELFKDKNDQYLDLSGLNAGRLVNKLGLTVSECRISASNFRQQLQLFLEKKPINPPLYQTDRPRASEAKDPYTFSNCKEVSVVNMQASLKFDFDHQQIEGVATYTLGKQTTNQLVLDIDALNIQQVSVKSESGEISKASFKLGDKKPYLGQPLTIFLPAKIKIKEVIIKYRTDTHHRSAGLQWLAPAQTGSGQKPFFLNQGQPFHNRGLFPLQDTPAAKMTVDLKILVKKGLNLQAVASSNQDHQGNPPTPDITSNPHYAIWNYRIDQPVSSYLLMIAVGELKGEKIDERTILYTEPYLIEKAKIDYQKFPEYLKKAEAMFGPLPWRVLNVLMMPNSFPYQGMEAIGLNGNSSDMISGKGDPFGISLALHELSHSWFGNLATYTRLEDLWLSEGLTNYAEILLNEQLWGEEDAAIISTFRKRFLDQLIRRVADKSESCLATKFSSDNPDNVISEVVYGKGYLFAKWLENRFGREKFLKFLREEYLSPYQTQSMRVQTVTTEDFIHLLLERDQKDQVTRFTKAELEQWAYSPGIPEDAPHFESKTFQEVESTAQRWMSVSLSSYAISEWSTWRPLLKIQFFSRLQESSRKLSQNALDSLKMVVSQEKNIEVLFSWYALAAKNAYNDAGLKDFLQSGRARSGSLIAIFSALKEGGRLDFARSLYNSPSLHKPSLKETLHPITQNAIDELLKEEKK